MNSFSSLILILSLSLTSSIFAASTSEKPGKTGEKVKAGKTRAGEKLTPEANETRDLALKELRSFSSDKSKTKSPPRGVSSTKEKTKTPISGAAPGNSEPSSDSKSVSASTKTSLEPGIAPSQSESVTPQVEAAPMEGILRLESHELSSDLRAWDWHLGLKAQSFSAQGQWRFSDIGLVSVSNLKNQWLPTLEFGSHFPLNELWSAALLFEGSYLNREAEPVFTSGVTVPRARLAVVRAGFSPSLYRRWSETSPFFLSLGLESAASLISLSSADAFARGSERIFSLGGHLGATYHWESGFGVSARYKRLQKVSGTSQISLSSDSWDAGVEVTW